MIYFFDPGGRGRRPVELYKDIAEKYGFVIAGSNNSRNFSSDQSNHLNALWRDTHLRLALDERRTYTSGFSGGARVAGSIALGCAPCQIAGVVAHGAGYRSNKPEAKDKMLYFLAVGDHDFNWPEVIRIRREREDKDLQYRVRVFPGPHQWTPPGIREDAVEWLMLKAMQTHDLTPDSGFIDRMFRQRQAEAEKAERNNDALAQRNASRSLVSDFSGLKDTPEAERKVAALKSSTLKGAVKKEQEQIADQSTMESEISEKLHAYVDGTAHDLMTLRNDILQEMGRLGDQAEHSKSEVTRLVSKRAFDDLWIEGIETGQQELEPHHFEKAEACFQLMSKVRYEPWPVLLLAETHATAGNRKQAIQDLQEAVRRGLKDPEVLESDSKLQILKPEAEFQKLIEELKHK